MGQRVPRPRMLPQQNKDTQKKTINKKTEIVGIIKKRIRIENLPLNNPVVVDKTYHPLQTANKRKKIWKLI